MRVIFKGTLYLRVPSINFTEKLTGSQRTYICTVFTYILSMRVVFEGAFYYSELQIGCQETEDSFDSDKLIFLPQSHAYRIVGKFRGG